MARYTGYIEPFAQFFLFFSHAGIRYGSDIAFELRVRMPESAEDMHCILHTRSSRSFSVFVCHCLVKECLNFIRRLFCEKCYSHSCDKTCDEAGDDLVDTCG